MSDTSTINYTTHGRRWAHGWNRYEAPTMSWLMVILGGLVLLGAVAGAIIGLLADFSLGGVLLMVLGAVVLALLVGIAIARMVIPFLWDVMLTRGLEK
jgi:hypothetical protein